MQYPILSAPLQYLTSTPPSKLLILSQFPSLSRITYMMYTSAFISILAVTSTTQAFPFSNIRAVTANIITRSLSSATSKLSTRQDQCAVWRNISTTLTAQFLADGECTDAARAAIRAAFHDCFNGACDGSLILANECSNSENIGLSRLCGNLANVATQANVGVADLIQFAAGTSTSQAPSLFLTPPSYLKSSNLI
jgi:hypothetical protein